MFYKTIRIITSILSTLALSIIAYTLFYFVNNGLRIHGNVGADVTGGVYIEGEVNIDSKYPLDVKIHTDWSDPIDIEVLSELGVFISGY